MSTNMLVCGNAIFTFLFGIKELYSKVIHILVTFIKIEVPVLEDLQSLPCAADRRFSAVRNIRNRTLISSSCLWYNVYDTTLTTNGAGPVPRVHKLT
jgi:hypothetical protein